MQAIAVDKTRFTSPRVERSNGNITVLEKGVYTACEPCKDHPERPPLWQVRARGSSRTRSTHTSITRTRGSKLWGVPIAYMPYFSAPDPTVNRQSGAPDAALRQQRRLGYGFSMPYFFNLAPNYDLTVDPTF